MFKSNLKSVIIPQKISRIDRDKILKDNPNIWSLWGFYEWIAVFEKRDYSQWWINIDWTIIKEGLDSCNNFKNGIAKYTEHWIMKYIDKEGKNLSFFFTFSDKRSQFIDSFNDWKDRYTLDFDKNWVAIFKDFNERFWLVDKRWELLIHWCDKSYPFDEEINRFAKFVKNWEIWFININWEIFLDKEIWGIQYFQNNWKLYLKSVLLKNNK